MNREEGRSENPHTPGGACGFLCHRNSIDTSRTWGPTRWGGADAPYKCFRLWRKPWCRGGSADLEHYKLLTATKEGGLLQNGRYVQCAKQPDGRLAHFCILKTPGCAGEFKKSFSVPYEEKTPFDTIRVRSANCTKVSKGGQKA